MATKAYQFSNSPDLAFEEGGLLAGFDPDGAEYSSDRAQALYEALGVAEPDSDMEYTLGALPDGRWALIGATVEGHSFAVETS